MTRTARRIATLALATASALATFGCKTRPQCSFTEKRRSADVDADRAAVGRDVAAARAGKPVCPGLFPLRVEQRGTELVVPFVYDGHARGVVAQTTTLPKERIDAREIRSTVAYRQMFATWYPDKPKPEDVDLELDGALDAARAASAIAGLGLGGYRHERIRAGDAAAELVFWHPDDVTRNASVLVAVPRAGGFSLRFEGGACARAGAVSSSIDDLGTAASTACAAGCDALAVEVDPHTTARDLVRTLHALLEARPLAGKPVAIRDPGATTSVEAYDVFSCSTR